MNLEYVSVESPISVLPPPQKNPKTAAGPSVPASRMRRFNEPPSLDAAHKQAIIEDAQSKMARQGLFGARYVHDYLMELCRRNCRPNTLRSRFGTILVFLQYLKAKGGDLLEAICREDLCAFIEQEQDRGLKPTSVSCRIDGLYAFIRFLVEREVLAADLLKRKLRVKVPDSLPRAIDPQDVRRLLAEIQRPRERAMVLVLLRTGMRIGELLSTRLCDVDLVEQRIEIVETQKNRVGRVVYLAEDACRALAQWIELRRFQTALIFSGHGGLPLSYETARSTFKKLLVRTDLAHKGYTLHCLRHTFASELLNAGMRLECLQVLLGHSCLEMTRRYARLTDVTRKEEYFRAMAKIEKDGIHGDYRCDHQLP